MLRTALALVLVTMTGISSAIAQSETQWIPVQYQMLPTSDPRVAPLWSDLAQLFAVAGDDASILVMELPTSNGGSYVIQMLYGPGCGINTCTVRIAEDGRPFASFSVCDDYSQHFLSADGTRFSACGKETDLTEAMPPVGVSLP